MLEDKIINNNYDNVEYGTEGLGTTAIAVNPAIADRYEESISENIDEIYVRKELDNKVLELYNSSKYYQKYKQDVKKLEKGDVADIYYTFKSNLKKAGNYNLVQIFCAIAEFFELNYKTLYNDILTIEDKAEILETLRETHGLDKEFSKSKKLF